MELKKKKQKERESDQTGQIRSEGEREKKEEDDGGKLGVGGGTFRGTDVCIRLEACLLLC